jgi:hypothetical protein
MTLTQTELEDLARTTLARHKNEAADAQTVAEIAERNDEAKRLHLELGYPFVNPPAETTAFASLGSTPAERAMALLDRLETVVHKAGRHFGSDDEIEAYYIDHDFERLQGEGRHLPEETVRKFRALVAEVVAMIGESAY